MVITKIAKYSLYCLLLYKIKWTLKVALVGIKLLMYIAPSLIFYGGAALLTL